MEIDLADLFSDGATVLEVYLCNQGGQSSGGSSGDGGLDVCVGHVKPFDIRVHSALSLREYYYKDISCSYDKSNDSQKVTRKTLIKDFQVGNLYIVALKEEQVPSYSFPVTLDMAATLDIERKTIRLNNRMHIINDIEQSVCGDDTITYHYLYLRYTHSDAVDITKIKTDINDAISRLLSFA
jgi:hypothetical protein